MIKYLKLIISAALMAALLNSCFTGIESTPRISSGDVRKRDAAVRTPEQQFLSDIRPASPGSWQNGKRFYVTDDKISIIFQPGDLNSDSLSGHNIIFQGFEEVPSVTGGGATILIFSQEEKSDLLHYRVNAPLSELQDRERLEVPFTVERSVVEKVDSTMRSNTFYISTPKWFIAEDDKPYVGKRHIPVTVTHVEPGTYIYPLRIYFRPEGSSMEYWIPMTVGDDRAATRNFHTVFNFDNPRKHYTQITDETWELITNSRVIIGMTRDECRLALGAPNSYRTIPVYNATVEQWNFDEGIYLIFEDGILTRYRI